MKMKAHDSKLMGCGKSCSKMEMHSNKIVPQEIRKIMNKQPNFTPKGTRRNNTQSQQKEKYHKDQRRNK